MTHQSGQFVVLRHDHPFLHWDLMLEVSGALRTWRLLSEPLSEESIVAEQLPDHRLDYLDYEGPVSGGRGTVSRWDKGTYTKLAASDERLVCLLRGERLAGSMTLTSMEESNQWQFEFR